MLNLVTCYKTSDLNSGDRAARFGMLTGIAFSLWRAAFLASLGVRPYLDAGVPVENKPSQAAHAVELLRTVLATNTVSFAVDQKTQYWMGQYYIDNAAYRLDEYMRSWPEGGHPIPMQRFNRFWSETQLAADYVESARAWMLIFKPFADLVRAFMAEMNVQPISKMDAPEAGDYHFEPHPASLESFLP
jgi:hypothetical protein